MTQASRGTRQLGWGMMRYADSFVKWNTVQRTMMSLKGHSRNIQISRGIPTRTLKWKTLSFSGVNTAAPKAGRILPEATHLEPSFYWSLGVMGMSHHRVREWDNWRAPAESDVQREGSAISTECFRRYRILLLSRKYLKPQWESYKQWGLWDLF